MCTRSCITRVRCREKGWRGSNPRTRTGRSPRRSSTQFALNHRGFTTTAECYRREATSSLPTQNASLPYHTRLFCLEPFYTREEPNRSGATANPLLSEPEHLEKLQKLCAAGLSTIKVALQACQTTLCQHLQGKGSPGSSAQRYSAEYSELPEHRLAQVRRSLRPFTGSSVNRCAEP